MFDSSGSFFNARKQQAKEKCHTATTCYCIFYKVLHEQKLSMFFYLLSIIRHISMLY